MRLVRVSQVLVWFDLASQMYILEELRRECISMTLSIF